MPPHSTPWLLTAGGAVILAACVTLAVTVTPLGSPLFFSMTAIAAVAYVLVLRHVWSGPDAPGRWLLLALAFAVAFRAPLALTPVGADNDMVRYLWDGRVQRLGYNPYLVVPADPSLAGTHTEQTRQMPSRRARTPYPPAAQLFFRAVSAAHDSTLAMKLAIVGCDLLTIVVLWHWLVVTGRNQWLALAYAWNPVVVIEIAHGGHIDAVGALWITASAYWLTRRRTLPAVIAFVLAFATKLLPIVLAPLFWRRVRLRDAIAGAVVLVALYLPFTYGTQLPLGAVPNVIAHIRFNGPVFRIASALAGPGFAAALAVSAGLAIAVWARLRLDADDPAGWAWPMALSLACAPVIYPWYLLYITPFLFTAATAPLIAWTLAVSVAYVVWNVARHGGPWIAPVWVMALEYAALAAAGVLAVRRLRAHEPGRVPAA